MSFFDQIAGSVEDRASRIASGAEQSVNDAMGRLRDVAGSAQRELGGAVQGAGGAFGQAGDIVRGGAQNLVDRVSGGVASVEDLISHSFDPIRNAWNGLNDRIQSFTTWAVVLAIIAFAVIAIIAIVWIWRVTAAAPAVAAAVAPAVAAGAVV